MRRMAEAGLELQVSPAGVIMGRLAHETPQPLSGRVAASVERSCAAPGIESLRLPSGAGHDAAQMARLVRDTSMIFVPSRDGVRHAPQEWTDERDILRGAQVLLLTLLDLTGRTGSTEGTRRHRIGSG